MPAADATDFTASSADLVTSETALPAVSVVSFTVSLTVSVTFSVVSFTAPDKDESFVAEAEADGAGLVLDDELEPEWEPPRTPDRVSPMVPSRPPPSEADGSGVDVPPPDAPVEDVDGLGVPSSSEPESDEEVLPGVPSDGLSAEADDVGSGVSADSDALAEADGDGEAEASLESWGSRASTHFWYSSTDMLLDGEWSSARANAVLIPTPMKTAVGIAARAIALPAGMWNLVNSGFLGAAWRGPVLARDASTSAPSVTSSAGTVPPVRPVGRARS
ncbi:hypothetical protein GCM10022207_57710 [Streptomyces lannensis]|uniref:Uncharacterized protein n=1 Tax=Streptomyces lannensis TaxID=766498 RepID=A0ABP7KQE2_9ACTN